MGFNSKHKEAAFIDRSKIFPFQLDFFLEEFLCQRRMQEGAKLVSLCKIPLEVYSFNLKTDILEKLIQTYLIQVRELKNSGSIVSRSFNINFLFNIFL